MEIHAASQLAKHSNVLLMQAPTKKFVPLRSLWCTVLCVLTTLAGILSVQLQQLPLALKKLIGLQEGLVGFYEKQRPLSDQSHCSICYNYTLNNSQTLFRRFLCDLEDRWALCRIPSKARIHRSTETKGLHKQVQIIVWQQYCVLPGKKTKQVLYERFTSTLRGFTSTP